jgi:hypothetical protein
MFAGLGEPAPSHTLPPPPGPADAERRTAVAAGHGTQILGPTGVPAPKT